MSLINTIETKIKVWLKPVPHLPANARQWLGENVWWIAGIGAIVSAIGALMGITGYFQSMATINAFGAYAGIYNNVYTGSWMITIVVSAIFTIATALLLATAVQPLRAKQKKGWNILFLILLVEAVYVVVNAILTFEIIGFIFSLIFGAIGLAVGAYVTLEIESQFEHVVRTKKTVKK